MVGYVLYKVVPVKIASSEFFDTMQEQAAFGSVKDPKFIEYEILKKAEELQIPVTKENLKITKARESIKVEAHDGLHETWEYRDPNTGSPYFRAKSGETETMDIYLPKDNSVRYPQPDLSSLLMAQPLQHGRNTTTT